MSETDAITGQGTIFKRNATAMGEIKSISGPSKSRDTIDVTVLDTVDGYRRFIGGLRDGGTVTLTMHFVRANYLLLNEDFESDTEQTYSVVLPDTENTTFEFDGLITELPLNVPIGDVITADVTIKISGKPRLDGATA